MWVVGVEEGVDVDVPGNIAILREVCVGLRVVCVDGDNYLVVWGFELKCIYERVYNISPPQRGRLIISQGFSLPCHQVGKMVVRSGYM